MKKIILRHGSTSLTTGAQDKFYKFLVLLGVMIFSFRLFVEAVPPFINYQGLLAQDGIAVNGSRDIVFNLYNAQEGGNMLWMKMYSQLSIIDGVFNVELGPFDPVAIELFSSNQNIYLEIEVEGEKFPRQYLVSVGYAFRAQKTATIDDNAVTTEKIAEQGVETSDIRDGTILPADLSDDVLQGGGLGPGSVTTYHLADDSITSVKIDDEAVAYVDLAIDAVHTDKILNGEVTYDDLANDAVHSDKILNGEVTADDLASNAVTTVKIEDEAVTAAKLAPGAIPNSIPMGVIVMWTGTIAPSGWALCDGQNDTPDLRDSFIVGALNTFGVGQTGGTDSQTASGGTSSNGAHPHGHTLGTAAGGGHDHGFGGVTGSANAGTSFEGGGNQAPSLFHGHSYSGTTGSVGGHSHTVNGAITSAGSHNHSFTSAGFDNKPLFYALAFIMKL